MFTALAQRGIRHTKLVGLLAWFFFSSCNYTARLVKIKVVVLDVMMKRR